MSKILITGGGGYIGSMLTSELIGMGHQVLVVDLMKYDKGSLNHLYYHKNFKLIQNSLYETVLVSANDELVNLFLKKKISFLDISKKLIMIINLKEFTKLKSIKPLSFNQIFALNEHVRLKTKSLCVRSSHNV